MNIPASANYLKTLLKPAGLFLMITSSLIIILIGLFNQELVRFFEIFIFSDNQIEIHGKRQLFSVLFSFATIVFAIGALLFNMRKDLWGRRIAQVFFTEPLHDFSPLPISPRFQLLAPLLIGLGLMFTLFTSRSTNILFNFLYGKDYGVIDLLVPICMFTSACLILAATKRLWNHESMVSAPLTIYIGYGGLAMLLIIYSGEEISWGQDFFNWETTKAFAGNVENETNVHNFFNDYFKYAYYVLTLLFIATLLSAWLEYNQFLIPYNRFFLPHPRLIGLSLLISLTSIIFVKEQELMEEMVAVFFLFYSSRIFKITQIDNLRLK